MVPSTPKTINRVKPNFSTPLTPGQLPQHIKRGIEARCWQDRPSRASQPSGRSSPLSAPSLSTRHYVSPVVWPQQGLQLQLCLPGRREEQSLLQLGGPRRMPGLWWQRRRLQQQEPL